MKIPAKFSSVCPACGFRIRVGDEVEWERGSPARHAVCPAAERPKATPPKMADRPKSRT